MMPVTSPENAVLSAGSGAWQCSARAGTASPIAAIDSVMRFHDASRSVSGGQRNPNRDETKELTRSLG